MNKTTNSVIAVGDRHFPYPALKPSRQTLEYIAARRPKVVVQIGDLYDFYYFSKYPKKYLSITPKQEVDAGFTMAENFWKQVQKVSPNTACFQLLGNHDDRPLKRLMEKAPELEVFVDIDHMFTFKGVKTLYSSRDELDLKINGQKVVFMHGHRSKIGDHMTYNEVSTVVGHSHTGGVVYKHYRNETRFELNCGYLGDPKAGPLQYGPQAKKYWTHGVGEIDNKGPRFIPL